MPTTQAANQLARALQQQYSLFQLPPTGTIANNAAARNAYGSLAQELVCAALNLQPIPIDGRCAICFDAEANGQFYEIKSVHRSGKLVIYDWRVEKEAAYPTLLYALWVHKVRNCRNMSDLLPAMLTNSSLWLVPASDVHKAAAAQPLRHLLNPSTDPRNGYSRAGYIRGYRNVPLAGLQPAHSRPLRFTYCQQQYTTTLYD